MVLGINMANFKESSPCEQLKRISVVLYQYDKNQYFFNNFLWKNKLWQL